MPITNKSWPNFKSIKTFLCFLLPHVFGCKVSSPTFKRPKHYAWKTHLKAPSMVLLFHPPRPHVCPRISSRWRNGTVLERPLQWKSQISKRRYACGSRETAAASPGGQGFTFRLAVCPSTLSTLPPLEGTMAPGWGDFSKVCWRWICVEHLWLLFW